MRDPEQLALHGEQTQIYALFTDLEGFTKLSHAITPETLSRLLNRYLDLMSDIVLKHGGTLDKFVGDALVTFWGAPIARPDDADRAVRAGRAMYEAGEEFRAQAGRLPATTCRRSASPASASTAARRWSAISAARGGSSIPRSATR